MLLIAIALFPQLTDDPGQLWTISLLVNIMSLPRCQIHYFTLSKILTLVELIASFAGFFILIGLGNPFNYSWYEYLIDLILLCCLALELFGLQMKIYGIIVFGCAFRCFCLVVSFLGFIGVIVFGYLCLSETITEPGFVEIMDEPAW